MEMVEVEIEAAVEDEVEEQEVAAEATVPEGSSC